MDALAVVAASIPIKEMVFLHVYYQPTLSITTDQVSQIDESFPYRLTPIMHYLSSVELSDNRVEAHKIQFQAARFSLVNGQLYKLFLDGPYLKCLTPHKGHYILAELYEGICRNHQGGKTLAHRART